MRSHEKPLVQILISARIRPDFETYRWRGKPFAYHVDILLFTADITAVLSKPAPCVLYERTSHNVRADLRRLFNLNEFAVAIVNKYTAVKAEPAYKFASFFDFCTRKSVSQLVAARALNIYNLNFIVKTAAYFLVIEFAVFKPDVLEINPKVL